MKFKRRYEEYLASISKIRQSWKSKELQFILTLVTTQGYFDWTQYRNEHYHTTAKTTAKPNSINRCHLFSGIFTFAFDFCSWFLTEIVVGFQNKILCFKKTLIEWNHCIMFQSIYIQQAEIISKLYKFSSTSYHVFSYW